jgi:hypothetical protein
MSIHNTILTVIFACVSASAQTLDWTRDVAPQFKALQGQAPAVELSVVHVTHAAAQAAASPRIEAAARAGKDSLWTNADHQHTTQDYLALEKGGGIEAVHSDCDDTIDDCYFLFFDFPLLKAGANGNLELNGEPVAAFTTGGTGITLLNGYTLKAERSEFAGGYRIKMRLEKTALSYQGIIRLANETRAICFTLSPEKVDQFEGDPDVSQGVFVTQAIKSFKEEGPSYKGQCATSMDHNGNYIRSCSGLYLTGAGALSRGEVFTSLSRYDPGTGQLTLQPVGSFELKQVENCR